MLPSGFSVVPFAIKDGEASEADEEDVAFARSETEESERTDESEAATLGERELDDLTVADADADEPRRLLLADEDTCDDVRSWADTFEMTATAQTRTPSGRRMLGSWRGRPGGGCSEGRDSGPGVGEWAVSLVLGADRRQSRPSSSCLLAESRPPGFEDEGKPSPVGRQEIIEPAPCRAGRAPEAGPSGAMPMGGSRTLASEAAGQRLEEEFCRLFAD
jgi:hypothetical protein